MVLSSKGRVCPVTARFPTYDPCVEAPETGGTFAGAACSPGSHGGGGRDRAQVVRPGHVGVGSASRRSVELARTCAAVWTDTTRRMLAVSSRGMVSQLHENDLGWLTGALERVGSAIPDREAMTRSDEITSAVPYDAAAVAAFNAGRWIVRQYEITNAGVRLY
jgi:hypothetical protein